MADTEPAGITVLHVEDDRAYAELSATFLERQEMEFHIRTVLDPREAVDALDDEAVDCILSDYDMPWMDGIELLRTVRRDHAELPFILFTGKGSEEVASEAISAGVTDYLQKNGHGGQFAVLANRVRNAVESYRREQAAKRYYEQLEAITRHSHDAILTVDADGRIRFANPAVESHFGYAPDEVEGQRLTALMPERFRDRHRRGFERYLRTGERTVSWSNAEFDGLHKDGSEVPLQISYGEYTHDGEPRFIGIMRERPE